MNHTDGVVVRTEGEYVWVRAEGAGHACGACARRGGCAQAGGGTLLDGLTGKGETLLRFVNTIRARPGDAVTICAVDGMVLHAAWLLYGLPLLLAFVGAVFASLAFDNDVAILLGMLAGLATGFFLAHRSRLERSGDEPILSIDFKQSS